MEILSSIGAFLSSGASTPVWALASVIVTQYVALKIGNQKSKIDSTSAHLVHVQQASQSLVDNLFRQVTALNEEVKRLREASEYFEKKYEEACQEIEDLRKVHREEMAEMKVQLALKKLP